MTRIAKALNVTLMCLEHFSPGSHVMEVRILIADDDKTIRLLLHRFLESRPSWKVCDEAADGLEAVTKAEQWKPEVVILDLAMPVMNGFQAAERLSRTCPSTALLLISVQQVTREVERSAREAGFKGALTKANGAEVVAAVEALLRGESFFIIDDSVQVV